MLRLRLSVAIALALAALVALLGACRPDEPKPGPATPRPRLAGGAKGWNVVLLTVDTLRADRLGAYGYKAWPNSPASPEMDGQLAAGALFESAMAQRAATWPSLASLLTGLYPSAHGVAENGYGFPDGLPTLPKALHAAGYRTGAFLSNMCDANHQGWDDFACTGGQDGKTVDRARDWAGKLPPGRPFFLWVHLFGAHGPYYNGGDTAARVLDPGYDGPVRPKRWALDELNVKKPALSGRDLRHLDALYDAAVQGSDHSIGAVLAALRAAGRLERTLVILTADHGEELYAHNRYLYHSCSVYQTALHVPLGISAPGLVPAGARVPQTVELIDVMPTVLALLGLPAPREQHGRSLVPYLERPGGGGPGKPAFSEYGASTVHTVVQDGWKLIDNPDGYEPVCIPNAPPRHYPIGRAELFDLTRDPREQNDLAASSPAKVAELARLIRQRFAGLTRREHPQDVPDKIKRELKALGYVAK